MRIAGVVVALFVCLAPTLEAYPRSAEALCYRLARIAKHLADSTARLDGVNDEAKEVADEALELAKDLRDGDARDDIFEQLAEVAEQVDELQEEIRKVRFRLDDRERHLNRLLLNNYRQLQRSVR